MLNDLMLAQLTRGITGSAGAQTGPGKGGGYKTKGGGATSGAGASDAPDYFKDLFDIGISTISFGFDFVDEMFRPFKDLLDDNPQAAKVLKFMKIVPFAGDIIGCGEHLIDNWGQSGNYGLDIVNAINDSRWDIGTALVGKTPYVGPFLEIGLEVWNYVEDGVGEWFVNDFLFSDEYWESYAENPQVAWY
jgi:hypothetical protein